MWYLYILECKNDKLYTGITKDVQRRFNEHCQKKTRFTGYNPPQRICYTEPHARQSDALKREAEIKRWPKKKKLALISAAA